MGVRLQSYFYSFNDDYYEIEVIDENYAGSPINFDTKADSLILTYNGSSKERMTPIITTDFSFDMYVSNQDHIDFFNDLGDQNEGRFFIKVDCTPFGESINRMVFVGHLVIDETYLENRGTGRFISIKSSDGLFRLMDQEYKSDTSGFDYFGNALQDSEGNPSVYYRGYSDLLSMIYEALQGVGTLDYYGSSQDFLLINHNWYESTMGSLSASPFEQARIKHEVFTQRNDELEFITMSRADVLNNILTAFGASISYVEGYYVIEAINTKGLDSKTYFAYDKSANLNREIIDSDPFHVVEYPSTNGYYALANGKFTHLPGLRSACLSVNYQPGSFLDIDSYWDIDGSTLKELGFVYVETETTNLNFYTVIRGKLDYIVSPVPETFDGQIIKVYFGVKIKVGSYYYVTEVTEETRTSGVLTYVTYKFENKWSLTEGHYLMSTPQDYTYNVIEKPLYLFENIETPPLREILDGGGLPVYNIGDSVLLSAQVEFIKVANPANWNIDYFPSVPLESEWQSIIEISNWFVERFIVSASYTDEAYSKPIGVKICGESNKDNSFTQELTTLVYDGAINSNNGMEIHNGSSWNPSEKSWGVGSLAGGDTLSTLLLNEVVAGQKTTISRYMGSFRGMRNQLKFIQYDGKKYIPFFYTLNLNTREWNGEFYEYKRVTPALTITNGNTSLSTGGIISVGAGSNTSNTPSTTSAYYPFKYNGAGSREIVFTDIPLPDPSAVSEGQINILCNIYRNGVRIWYGTQREIDKFSINYADSKVILGRALDVGDSIIGFIIKIT